MVFHIDSLVFYQLQSSMRWPCRTLGKKCFWFFGCGQFFFESFVDFLLFFQNIPLANHWRQVVCKTGFCLFLSIIALLTTYLTDFDGLLNNFDRAEKAPKSYHGKQNWGNYLKEHIRLFQKQASKVTLHFVWGHLSRKRTITLLTGSSYFLIWGIKHFLAYKKICCLLSWACQSQFFFRRHWFMQSMNLIMVIMNIKFHVYVTCRVLELEFYMNKANYFWCLNQLMVREFVNLPYTWTVFVIV